MLVMLDIKQKQPHNRDRDTLSFRASPLPPPPPPLPRVAQSRSQSFVPLDQRSENASSGSNHYKRTKEITEFWLSGSLRICIYGACLKWLLPELSFSDRWSRGTKLWERDCASPFCQLPLAPLLRVAYYPKWRPRKANIGFSRRRKTPTPTGRLSEGLKDKFNEYRLSVDKTNVNPNLSLL